MWHGASLNKTYLKQRGRHELHVENKESWGSYTPQSMIRRSLCQPQDPPRDVGTPDRGIGWLIVSSAAAGGIFTEENVILSSRERSYYFSCLVEPVRRETPLVGKDAV